MIVSNIRYDQIRSRGTRVSALVGPVYDVENSVSFDV